MATLLNESRQPLPRVIITYCTQCKWLLRAAYFAQELLSTFSTDLGEVSLRPGIGGIFTVDVTYTLDVEEKQRLEQFEKGEVESVRQVRIWDRKEEGGFPETKVLKRKVRDLILPGKGLGHVDRDHAKEGEEGKQPPKNVAETKVLGHGETKQACEDCA